MYLKAIELVGFKSFAERVRLDFADGMTTIVGANGSGKSNIIDAVLWVMGEQNSRNLRGAKMEEIIFSGSEKRKAVGMAEVTLLIDNQTGLLPIEYEEVAVKRRLFRDGTSEYYINNQHCRLRDVVELFLDTGVGKDSFSIISQGQVDAIITDKPAERRVIIEEVAGISKFKYRKKEAVQKMERLQERLQRVDDIIAELDTQLTPLRLQALKAEQYLQIKKKLNQAELAFYAAECEKNETEITTAERLYQKDQDQYAAAQAKLAAELAILEKLKLQQIQADSAIDEQNRKSNALGLSAERLRGEEKTLNERLQNLQQTRQRLTEAGESNRLRRRESVKRIAQREAEIADCRQEQQCLQQSLSAVNEELRQLAQRQQQQRQQRESISRQISQAEQSILRLQLQAESLRLETEALQQRLQGWDSEQKRLDGEQLAAEAAFQQWLTQTETLQRQLQQSQTISSRLQAEAAASAAAHQQKEQQLKLQQEQIRLKSARLHTLIDLADQMDGYQRGVKAVLAAKKNRVTSMEGVVDSVANLFSVAKKYETALEVALGGALQNLVVKDPQAAEHAIDWLKQQKSGRATFLPLTVVQGQRDAGLWQRISAKPGVLALATDLVQCEPLYRKIADHLLSGVIVTDNLATAGRLSAELAYRYRIVTLEGEVIYPGGAVTGGSLYQRGVGLLGREREIRQLEEELVQEKTAAMQLQTELTLLHQTMLQNVAEAEKQQLETEQLRQTENTQKESKAALQWKLAQIAENRQIFSKEERQAREKIERLAQERQQIVQQTQTETEQKSELSARLALADAEEDEQKRLQQEEERNQLKLRLAVNQQRLNELQRQQNEQQQQTTEMEAEREELASSLAALTIQESETAGEISAIRSALRDTLQQQQTAGQHLAEVRRNRLKFSESFQEQDDRIEQARRSEDAAREASYHSNLRLSRSQNERAYLAEKLMAEYQMLPAQLKEIDRSDLPAAGEALTKEITRLRAALREMGVVNLGAIEEKLRLEERRDFLDKQGADIRESCQGIWKVIAKIDKEMRERFEEAFRQVDQKFRLVFAELFGGGQAHLSLTEPEDMLTTGLEIIAQLPGKKAGNLSLLSGGEHALTAVALLIAILQVKKPPFCLLDEIESSLDEGNVKKVAKVLKTCAGDTQIISISHRKGMMEESDALIGVTMQTPGISSIISVRFHEREE
ncbi:MAG: chromosome segregation protein SMC [Negativicutes bacterium]|nr:chromosome segregation protein SMC [Negativicutes bacterium]